MGREVHAPRAPCWLQPCRVEGRDPRRRVCRPFAPLSMVQPMCGGLEGCSRASGSVDADADRNWLKNYVYWENRTKETYNRTPG